MPRGLARDAADRSSGVSTRPLRHYPSGHRQNPANTQGGTNGRRRQTGRACYGPGVDEQPITPEAILKQLGNEAFWRTAVTPETLEAGLASLARLAGGHGPAHEPFFRDLLGRDSAVENEAPMPAWAARCGDRIASVLPDAADAGRRSSAGRSLGRAIGLALGAETVAQNPGRVTPEAAATLASIDRNLKAAASRLLAVSVHFPSGDRADFLEGLAETQHSELWKNPEDHLGPFGQFYPAVVWGWREIAQLPTRTAFHAWLTDKLGVNVVGDAKRVERFCAEIGLKFKGRGRPKNEGAPAQRGPEKYP